MEPRRTTAFLLALPIAASMFVLAAFFAADPTARPDVSTLAFVGATWALLGATYAATHVRFERTTACVAAIVVAWVPAFGPRLVPFVSVVAGLVAAAVVARFELRRTMRVLAIASVAIAIVLSVMTVVKRQASARTWATAGEHAHLLRPGMSARVLDRSLVYVDTFAGPMSHDGEGCRLEGLGDPIQLRGCPVLVAHEDVRGGTVVVTWGHHPDLPPTATEWALVGFGRSGARIDLGPFHGPQLHVSSAMETAALCGEIGGLALLLAAAVLRRRTRVSFDAMAAAVTIVGVAPLGFGLLLA